MVDPDTPRVPILYGSCVLHYWVTKAKSTHSEFVKHIDFLQQELIGESV